MEYLMDQTKQNKIQQFSKKSIQILLSISAFSVLFSFSFLPLNDFSTQMRSYITDRNYIFLFCNGILVFIIKSSGFTNDSTSKSETNSNEFVKQSSDQVQAVAELAESRANYKEVVVENEEEQVSEDEDMDAEYEYIVDECTYKNEYIHEDEDEYFITESEGLLSTEELNKKCDDFIRKMREGIHIQA